MFGEFSQTAVSHHKAWSYQHAVECVDSMSVIQSPVMNPVLSVSWSSGGRKDC